MSHSYFNAPVFFEHSSHNHDLSIIKVDLQICWINFFLNGLKIEKCFSLSVLSLFENDRWVEISFGVFTLTWKYVRQFKKKNWKKNIFTIICQKRIEKFLFFIVFKVWNNTTRKFYCWVTKLWKLNWFLWFFVFVFTFGRILF